MRKQQIPKSNLIFFIVAFAVVGVAYLVLSRAASPYAVVQPESGTLAGGATVVDDATASGSKAVRFSTPAPPSGTAATADKNANAGTQAVYALLRDLPNRSSNKIISGQQVEFRSLGYTLQMNIVRNVTGGRTPGIVGAELIDFAYNSDGSSGRAAIRADMLNKLTDHWNAGGLVEVSYHMCSPNLDDSACGNDPINRAKDASISASTVGNVLTQGTTEYNRIMARQDTAIAFLQELQNRGVTVLWRPYHEHTQPGPTFWWGMHAQHYNNLWRQMFNRFTAAGLHNLIWVTAPNRVLDMYNNNVYPGDDYVDVIGLDAYSDYTRSNLAENYNTARQRWPSKPFALTELGLNHCDGTAQDLNTLLGQIKTNAPGTAYFLSWHECFALALESNPNAFYNDSWIANLSDFTR